MRQEGYKPFPDRGVHGIAVSVAVSDIQGVGTLTSFLPLRTFGTVMETPTVCEVFRANRHRYRYFTPPISAKHKQAMA